MIGHITHRQDPVDRIAGSLAAVYALADLGADMVRVHDVAATRDVLAVRSALRGLPGRPGHPG